MLDDYLKRTDVLNLMKHIRNNERYYLKSNNLYLDSDFFISKELALFLFYDALIKYKIIVDDIYLFDEYIEQLEKIYHKLDNYEDVQVGIHKLICRMLAIHFDIKDINLSESREKIISHIYDSYIINGYFVHGFRGAYYESLKKNDFIPGFYYNYYAKFEKLNEIFEKYHFSSVITKDFKDNSIFFTDDVVMGCYYSVYSPMFFYQFLSNKIFGRRFRKDKYLIQDYSYLMKRLKRFMSNNLFSPEDRNFVMDFMKEQWNLLYSKNYDKIGLLLVKRRLFFDNNVSLDEFLQDKNDLYEVVDRMLNPKYNRISYDEFISSSDRKLLLLDSSIIEEKKSSLEINPEEEYYKYKEAEVNNEFLNSYGSVSLLLLFGSLFISLGVIISIIMSLRG